MCVGLHVDFSNFSRSKFSLAHFQYLVNLLSAGIQTPPNCVPIPGTVGDTVFQFSQPNPSSKVEGHLIVTQVKLVCPTV